MKIFVMLFLILPSVHENLSRKMIRVVILEDHLSIMMVTSFAWVTS
jgi:hypothetical protein